MADNGEHRELVIIRRGGHGDHEEHHGGVWKIAFADFMTAMMAFFLVMWLISANDKTRASVARYFNPVRLVDATTQPRGLHDTKKDESGITASLDNKKADDKSKKTGETPETESKNGQDKSAQGKGAKETAAARQTRLDAALRKDPFAALAEIARGDEAAKKNLPFALPTPSIGNRGGEAYRDPFAPPPPSQVAAQDPAQLSQTAALQPSPAQASDRADPSNSGSSKAASVGANPGNETSSFRAAAKEVKAALASLKQGSGREGPQIDVKQTSEGLLVSFTDTSAFAMFASGSAVPARKLVLMMERVGKALKNAKGTVIVRGFTDNKPYRSGRYDNWHLSLDRAQVTHYMLVRGGLDDARIGHVEGYADRGAGKGTDPSSPVNRRIEILLQEHA